MTRSVLQIFGTMSAIALLMAVHSTSTRSLRSMTAMDCAGYSARIASDTIYDCHQTIHLFSADTNANFHYLWTGPNGFSSNDQKINTASSGIYSLIVTDIVNNCSSTDSIYVKDHPCEDLSNLILPSTLDFTIYLDTIAPILTIPSDTTIANGALPPTATAQDDCGAVNSLTYVDSSINDGCFRVISRTWTALDNCGNQTSDTQIINIYQPFQNRIATSDYNGSEISCNGAQDGVITVIASGAHLPITYAWDNGHTGSQMSNLDTGTYTIITSDARGCRDTSIVTLTSPGALVTSFDIDSISCDPNTDAGIKLIPKGGTIPYAFSWSDGSTTKDITGIQSGIYNVTITDDNGCTNTDSIEMTDPVPMSLFISIASDYNGHAVSCQGSGDASIRVSPQNQRGAVKYQWNTGSTDNPLNDLYAGTYHVTATDKNECIQIDSITIYDHPGMSSVMSITSDYNGEAISCTEAADGSVTVDINGGATPYTYIWSNGDQSKTIDNLEASLYKVTITDNEGCQTIDSIEVVHDHTPDISIVITSDYYGNAVSCAGASDGSIVANITQGIAPYRYLWNNGATTATNSNISAGVYNLTVTDANGCNYIDFIIVPDAAPISTTLQTTLVNCGSNDGQIYAAVTNGSGQYEYSLDSINWQVDRLFSGLVPGMYNVYARDRILGCVSPMASADLITASAPEIDNTTIIHPTMSANQDGALMITASGRGLAIEYQLDEGPWQSSNLFDGLAEGTYSINIRYQGQSCTLSESIVLSAGDGIESADISTMYTSPEISNISNLGIYFIPIGEDEILNALQTITPESCTNRYAVDPIQNYIYVGIVESGTIVTYDHWEDGFEPNLDFSIQTTTEIWGDGDPSNGLPPGFNIDYLSAGDKIFLNNAVVSTTRQAVVDYDAGDRLSSRGDISITRLGWATGSSTLFAGAVEVQEHKHWGNSYAIPVGENTDVNEMFSYTGFSVMAGTDNTIVNIDADANGTPETVIQLNQGESYLHNGGVHSGGTIESNQPVQVHLLTGDHCSLYESRWFTLSPVENWDSGYYMPVSTLNNGSTVSSDQNKPTYVHLYNPNDHAIDIIFRTKDGIIDSINVAGKSTTYQEIPEGTGAHFDGEENFYAIATIDSDSGNNLANDWGFALLPESQSSPQIYLTGFAPGQNPSYVCDVGNTVPVSDYQSSVSSEELIAIDGAMINAFDGDLSTFWSSKYDSGTSDPHPHELIIDLGQVHNLVGFRHINGLSTVTTSVYKESLTPIAIPNYTRYDTTLTIDISDNYSLLDLGVNIDIRHNKISDLRLTLESPTGKTVSLFNRTCDSNDDIIATFNDDASIPFDCNSSGDGLIFLPIDDLSVLEGDFIAGTWKLHINDNNGIIGGGTIRSWSLDITHGRSAPGAIKDFEFYVSDDGINWGIPVIEGTWIDSIPLHDERMPAIDARYVRFVSLSDFDRLGIASIGEFEILSCGSSYTENSSPLWITAGHSKSWSDTLDINICVDYNGDGGNILDLNGTNYDASFMVSPLGLLKIYDPDGDQTGIRVWVCDGSDGVIAGAWGQDPATASGGDPAIDLGVGLINSIPFSARKSVSILKDVSGNGVYDQCDEVTYTITIKNTGALPLSTGSIAIIDTLPSELEYISGTSRAMVDGHLITIPDHTSNNTGFPFDENGTTVDTIVLPGDSMMVKFDVLIANIDFGTFITNRAYAQSGTSSFDPAVSIPIQEHLHPLDTLVPANTVVSCEAFEYPDTSIDTLSFLAIHDTIMEGLCLDAYTFQRIYTYTDNCNRIYIDTMQITVKDTTPPVIVLPADTVISNSDLPIMIEVPMSDNCDSDVDLTFADDTIRNTCSYIIERVYTALDNCNNMTQDTIYITVINDDMPWQVDMTATDLYPCAGTTVELTSVLNSSDGLSYLPQWHFRSDSAQSWQIISNANQTNYSFVSDTTTTGYYQVIYTIAGTTDTHCIDHSSQIAIQTLPISPPGYITATICHGDTYDFYGTTLDQSGIYQDTLISTIGCDSIVELTLTIRPAIESVIRDTLCYGGELLFGGSLRTGSSTHYDTLTNIHNCDSIVQLILVERPALSRSIDLAICANESYIFNGKTVDTTGVYEYTLESSTGCDSLVTLNLLVQNTTLTTVPITVCSGDSVQINNVYIKSSGQYSVSETNNLGCDSTITYDVFVMEALPIIELQRTICEGDSILFDGRYISQEGEYQEKLEGVSTCDSTTILQLLVEPTIALTSENKVICEGESVQLNVQGASHIEWSSTEDMNCEHCPSPVVRPKRTTTYRATAMSCRGIEVETNMEVTVLPKSDITVSPDTSIVLGESLVLNTQTNDPFADVSWMSSTGDTLCIRCITIEVQPQHNTYYVAEIYNDQGCIDRDSIYVDLKDGCVEGQMIAPNYFTPNSDGVNDVFTIKWEGVKSVDKLSIFNRWGELVFTTNNVDEDFWDGTIDNQMANPAVFVYYVEYYCLNGNLKRYKGNVTLIL